MMENVYDGYRAAQVTEMLAQLSKPDADNGHGKELRNFNALPNNVYYVTEASPMLQRSDPSTWVGVVDNHRADEKVFAFLSLVAKKFPRLTFVCRWVAQRATPVNTMRGLGICMYTLTVKS